MKAALACGGAALSASSAFAQAGASYAPPSDIEQPSRAEGAPPPPEVPRGSSRLQPGEDRHDRVGLAGYAGGGAGIFATSNLLPPGSHAEVTALDSGKTILVAVRGVGPGLIDLSGAAASLLAVTGNPPVRVRRVVPSPQDVALLRRGQPASARADAPPALLAGLRRQLNAAAPQPERVAVKAPASPSPSSPKKALAQGTAPPVAKAMPPVAKPAPAPAGGMFVQIAALSNLDRARTLARQVGGVVRSAGALHRIQVGPFATAAAAVKARADLAVRGYGGALIVSIP